MTDNPIGVAPSPPTSAATPLGLRKPRRRQPRVARASQPWAGGHNPVGIARTAAWPRSISRKALALTQRRRCVVMSAERAGEFK